MFPLNTIIAWSINIIMNKKYDNNNIVISSRAYFLHLAQASRAQEYCAQCDDFERWRVCAATTASNVAFGHTSSLTHTQHLAFPHVSAIASVHSSAYARCRTVRKTVLNMHHLL
jgi:hypothetical protein